MKIDVPQQNNTFFQKAFFLVHYFIDMERKKENDSFFLYDVTVSIYVSINQLSLFYVGILKECIFIVRKTLHFLICD